MNHRDGGTLLHFRAVAAGGDLFFQRTLADLAHAFAEDRLPALRTTAVAVDMLRQDGGVVQLGPKFGGLFAQSLVVVFCGDKGIALFAVYTAAGNVQSHDN